MELPGGRPLHLVNLHLRAPSAAPVPGQKEEDGSWRTTGGWAEGCFVAAVKRAAQALEARLLVDRILDADPEALVVVLGDLNAGEGSTPLRLLAAEAGDTGNGRLAARSLVPLGAPCRRTGATRSCTAGGGRCSTTSSVSRPLLGLFRELAIHSETLGDDLAGNSVESDHAPLVAEFELPDP